MGPDMIRFVCAFCARLTRHWCGTDVSRDRVIAGSGITEPGRVKHGGSELPDLGTEEGALCGHNPSYSAVLCVLSATDVGVTSPPLGPATNVNK